MSTPNFSEAAINDVVGVLRSGHLVHGENCVAFEQELAKYLDCSDVIVVSSGTAALHLSLMALEIGPGDAVIVPDFTFPATANVVEISGATAVIVDVDSATYLMCPRLLEQAIAGWTGPEKLRAIIPVHEFGNPADMISILSIAEASSLSVIEDAACALGAEIDGVKAGVSGDLGCFSFHPRKTLTTGEGGAIATNDPGLARQLRASRSHGMERNAIGVKFRGLGLNYRMTDFQAALGRSQLPDLDARISARRTLASCYFECLAPLAASGELLLPTRAKGHSWQTFMTVLSPEYDRDSVARVLRKRGVEAGPGAQSMSSLGIYKNYRSREPLPGGTLLFNRGLALPFCEQMTEEDVRLVARILAETLGDYKTSGGDALK